ncbi:MAG: type IV pilus secretin PilQ [Candidatus Adiutrix sp.]|jgi:type IV pilus assembly protein PilQ|nr:type IV pilus secretin PilQ [Candidatus Adiutrix sp.]
MTRELRAIILLAALTAFCLGPWAASARAQGSFAPVAETTVAAATTAPAPVPAAPTVGVTDLDLATQTPQAMHYESEKVYTGERISLDFQNADLHNIIRIIGEVSGKNIVVSDEVAGKVTLKLKDVPWDQALDIVLSSRGLGVETSGNVLTVLNIQEIERRRGERDAVRARQMDIARLAPLSKKVFTPKYSPVSVVTTELTKLKGERGKISAIGNDIYVEDDPSALATMTQVFMRIDRVAKQILIEARIIEASTTFVERLGIRWGIGTHETAGEVITTGEITGGDLVGSADFSAGGRLGFAFLNKTGSLLLNASITASETSSDAKTISAPRIMAANDQEVSIRQGQQIPYTSGSSATTAANVQFKDVVMELRVKPHIEENGQIVTLDINLKNDTPANSGGAESEPAINTREATTKLMVKDGETVVIGGIIVDQQTTGIDRVPGLHRVPILGWLFQDRSINNQKSEMLIFITANIIPLNI